jgi:hypothetical protein
MYCMPMYLYYQHCNSAYFEAYLSCIIVVHLYISIFCFIYSPYVPHSVISRKPQTLYYFENSPHKPGGKSSFPFPRILSRLLFTTSAKTRFFFSPQGSMVSSKMRGGFFFVYILTRIFIFVLLSRVNFVCLSFNAEFRFLLTPDSL